MSGKKQLTARCIDPCWVGVQIGDMPKSFFGFVWLLAAFPLGAAGRLYFELNQGQFDPQVQFALRGRNYRVFLTGGETVLRLGDDPVRMRLIGSTPYRLGPLEPLAGKVNYFLGTDPGKWTTG